MQNAKTLYGTCVLRRKITDYDLNQIIWILQDSEYS